MILKEIKRYSEARYKIRAYLHYIFTRNLPDHSPTLSIESINESFKHMTYEVDKFDAFYVLDNSGLQVQDAISLNTEFKHGGGENRAHKAYYYDCIKEGKFVITDPYPSKFNGELCVTASMPIYNDKNELKFIACGDISLKNVLKIAGIGNLEGYFSNFERFFYALICAALFMICSFLFWHGVRGFLEKSFVHVNVEEIFESTIILTLALAIFDLVKTIFEEEVIGKHHDENSMIYKTMVRFIGSIIIALAIEALMLVFKFAITAPENIINAIYLISGVALLMVALSVYLFSVKKQEKK
ncbi:MAG: PDC sensor domain-containing protein [Campylobacter sp.]|nr:PDC sensor domain-containing protein [Campylobacter sp.]